VCAGEVLFIALAAQSQMMVALLDTAVNTSPFIPEMIKLMIIKKFVTRTE